VTAAALVLDALWPGGLQDYLPGLLGPSTALVDANLEMWRFFQRFTL
jgi:poly(3-hydroxybutyrate) depolymerase